MAENRNQAGRVPDWREVYAEEGYYFGRSPSSLGREVIRCHKRRRVDMEGRRALDLGAGEGRDAAALAQAGFQVTAVEIARSGVEKCRELCTERGVADRVETVEGNIEYFPGEREYDLIFAANGLQFLGRTGAREKMREFHSATPAGGWNAVAIFHPKTEMHHDPPLGMFELGELKEIYSGWEHVWGSEKFVQRTDDDGEPIQKLYFSTLISRKGH